MTDHDAALRLDALLDDLLTGDTANDPLASVAGAVHKLDERQRATPSDAFRAQMWHTLFASSNGRYSVTTADEPVAISPPRPAPRKIVQPNKLHRFFATAAALLLLIGSVGAVTRLPLGPTRDPEPSAIPVAALASPAESDRDAAIAGTLSIPNRDPQISGDGEIVWTSPEIQDFRFYLARDQYALSDRSVFQVFVANDAADERYMDLRAVDLQSGTVRWIQSLDFTQGELATYGDHLVIAGYDASPDVSGPVLLVLDGENGEELWRVDLSDDVPMELLIDGNDAFVLGDRNTLDVIDLAAGSLISSIDLTGDAKSPADVLFGHPGTGYRMLAILDGTLAAVLADGSVTGMDIDSGEIEWQQLRPEPGIAQVIATGDRFVIVDDGTMNQISVELQMSSGSGVSSSVATPESGIASCQDRVVSGPPEQIFALRSSAPRQTAVLGIDPDRGTIDWTAQVEIPLRDQIVTDRDVSFLTRSGAVFPLGPSDIVFCSVDLASGEIVQAESIGDVAERTALVVVNDTVPIETVIGVMGGSRVISVPASVAPDIVSPRIEATPEFRGAFGWIELVDDGWLLANPEGQLVKLSWQSGGSSTPEVAMPTPGRVTWDLDPPGSGASIDTVTETLSAGTLYRLVVQNDGDGAVQWVQAIDTETGAVRWERRFPNGAWEISVGDNSVAVVTVHRSLSAYNVVVLDAATGEERWQSELSGSQELSGAPVLTTIDSQLLVLTANGRLESFDLTTGEIDFSLSLVDEQTMASSPLRIRNVIDHSRFAFDGETLAVTVGDGSVVGVDLANGWIIWRVVPDGVGANAVYAIDGQFVAVAIKGLAASAPTVVPTWTPQTMPLAADDCPRFIMVGPTSDGTPAAEGQASEIELLGIDARGDVQWRRWATDAIKATVWVWGDDGALAMVASPSSSWPQDGSNAIVCAVEAASGTVSYVGKQTEITESTFTIRSIEDDEFAEIRIFEPGYGFAFLIEVSSVTGPYVDIDAAVGDITRVIDHGGIIYLTLEDGRLLKIDPGWSDSSE
ncbi:MAG: PQQ-binding-like beta-propeller repeat protein [Thermomicrobiales bacterium]|nr:PQQ-binding-like beta-propeller repeat protein [Thermomicrobiales bacterium]